MTFPALSLPQLYFNVNFFRCFLKLAETTVYKTSDYLSPKEERGGGLGVGLLSEDCRGSHGFQRIEGGSVVPDRVLRGGGLYIIACL